MTVYVKDTAPMAWGQRDKDTFLWHRMEAASSSFSSPGWVDAGCGHRISKPTEFIDHDMSFADWDHEYGDDVDLCQCAVSSPKDVAKVTKFMQENTDVE